MSPEQFYLYCQTLDRLAHVTQYLSTQYRDTLTRDEAIAHFASRKIVIDARFRVLEEAESLLQSGEVIA